MLDAQKRGNLTSLAKQKKLVPGPSIKDKKLEAMAEVTPLRTKRPALDSSSRGSEKLMLPSRPLLTRMDELLPTGTFHLVLPLLAIFQCKRAGESAPKGDQWLKGDYKA